MPDFEKLIRLSDILGISLDELIGREAKAEYKATDPQDIPDRKRRVIFQVLAAAALSALVGTCCFFLGRNSLKREEGSFWVLAENGSVESYFEPEQAFATEMIEIAKWSDEDFIVPFDREKTVEELSAYLRDNNPDLSGEEVLRLAELLADRIERIEEALKSGGSLGSGYHYNDDGALVIEIGKLIEGELVLP